MKLPNKETTIAILGAIGLAVKCGIDIIELLQKNNKKK